VRIAAKGGVILAPAASAQRIGARVPNSPHVRPETAPGGHCGTLNGSRAWAWQYLFEFLPSIDPGSGDTDQSVPMEETP